MRTLRILVTGANGQVATALQERAPPGVDVVALARPGLDLANPGSIRDAFEPQTADVVVNAAAYTAVDKAEAEQDLAMSVNGDGAGLVAEAARALGAPVIQLSTDYVFDGVARPPLHGGRPRRPDRRLRTLQARRRGGGRRRQSPPCHPAHRVGLQPVRRQFRENHAPPGRDPARGQRGRRPARRPDFGARHRRRRVRDIGRRCCCIRVRRNTACST